MKLYAHTLDLEHYGDVESQPEFNLDELISELIACFTKDSSPIAGSAKNQPEEVLYKMVVNGLCYKLTRSPIQPIPEDNIQLSPREYEIALLVSGGCPNKLIAYKLHISPHTVDTHIRRIYTKLGVSTRAEMVAAVLRRGLLVWDDFPANEAVR